MSSDPNMLTAAMTFEDPAPQWAQEMTSRTGIAGELLFEEDQFDMFEGWQAQKGYPLGRHGKLLNGFDWNAFMEWCDNGVLWMTEPQAKPKDLHASKCGHALHPINKESKYCPKCEIEICLQFQDALADLVDRAAGTAVYHKSRRGWRYSRLVLINAVTHHEKLAELEREYASEHQAEFNQLPPDLRSSLAAVEFANANTSYKANYAGAAQTNVSSAKKPKVQHSKRVTFVIDDSEVSEPRRNTKFQRSHRRYAPGKHAPTDPSNLLDTSGASSDIATIAQVRISVIGMNDEILQDRIQNIPAGEHALWPEIKEILSEQEDLDDYKNAQTLLVRMNEQDQIEEMRIEEATEEDEEEDDEESTGFSWMSMKQL